jgi:hypothetical protein
LKKKVAIFGVWTDYFTVEGLTECAPEELSRPGATVLQEFKVQKRVIFRGNSGKAFAAILHD